VDNIKKQCYALVQEIVVKRDVFCRCPGCNNLAGAGHHLFKRDRMATAFNTRYVIGVCVDCHEWARAEANEFREWVISWMGADEYEYGHQLSLAVCKYTDFKKVRDNLKQELAKYNSA
jgi:hypothetical protein